MLPINDEYYFGMIANAATSEKVKTKKKKNQKLKCNDL
jgi:hypothetical protein